MTMQIRWCFGLALCLAASGLAGLGDIPSPVFEVAEPSSGVELFAGTGIAFENCGGIDLAELDSLGYVDRTHFLSLAIGLAARLQIYRGASLEGKAFLAGPGSGYSLHWKQVVWRGQDQTLSLQPGYVYSSGNKNVFFDSAYYIITAWVHSEDLHGQNTVWELPLIYSTKIAGDSQSSALEPTFSLGARLAYAQYQMKWSTKETGDPTIIRNLGSNATFVGSVSGSLRFRLGNKMITNELGVMFVPQADNPKEKTVLMLGFSIGIPSDWQIFD